MRSFVAVTLSPILALAACSSDKPMSDEQKSAAVVQAAANISEVTKYFVDAHTTLQIAGAISADMTDSACVSFTTTANTLQADFHGCVSASAQLAIDGTVNATLSGSGATMVSFTASGLVTGDLQISGSWQLDLSGLLDLSAMWTGNLGIVSASGSAQATLTVDLGISGLCLDLSINADASFAGNAAVSGGGGSVNAAGSGDVSIMVNGLLACGGCPSSGQVSIAVDGQAAGSWNYNGSSAQLGASGAASASASVQIGFGGLGFGCQVE